MKIKLAWVVAVVLIAVLVGVVVLFLNVNRLVRVGVEQASTASLGLTTTVGSAQVSILGGTVGLNSFQVASPQGFAAPHFLEVGRIGLQVGYAELRKDPIRLDNLILDRPRLVLEQQGGKFNLKTVIDTIPPTDPDASTPNLVIGVVTVTGAEVVIRPGIPGVSQEVTVPLPQLTVREIGTAADARNGVAIREALLTVAAEMAKSAAGSERLPPEVRLLLQTALGDLRDQVGKTVRQAAGQVRQQVDQAARDAQRAVEQGLGGLLNPNRRP